MYITYTYSVFLIFFVGNKFSREVILDSLTDGVGHKNDEVNAHQQQDKQS